MPARPAGDKRLGLRGEGERGVGLDVIERLNAERVARQQQQVLGRVVQRQGIHAAQLFDETAAVAAIEVQRRLAVGRRREVDLRQCGAQLDVVVDLGIGDERSPSGFVERLRPGLEVDDRQAIVDHADVARDVPAAPIGTAMGQRVGQPVQDGRVGRRAVLGHDAGYAAHAPTACSKN